MINIINKCFGLMMLSLVFTSLSYAEDQKEQLTRAYDALAIEDYSLSFGMFERLGQKGSSEAHFALALFYKFGWGEVKQDLEQACHLFSVAAKKGIPAAQQEYGFCLLHHESSENPSDWFELAYESGVYEAACDKGRLYLGTKWYVPNVHSAIEWCQRAAERNAVKAQVTLGDIYSTNHKVFDAATAEYWYQQAINNRSGDAAYKLALLYLEATGETQGDEHSSNKALYFFEVASSLKLEKAYQPTAQLYWKKLQQMDQDGSQMMAKSYLWAKAAQQVMPSDETALLLDEIEREIPPQWKHKLDTQVEAFLNNKEH
ncbi:hypothetical protein ZX61_10745 [Vibrio sp. VPAP30]|uniref:Sel1 repeat family protein n=2 Tax=Vibrionaceae TaxID=641 RepID=A0A177Y1S8_9VIBR|nr:hypothetical protein ZX61_10745 [Vibrio sp. VPAP30]OAJ94829.1 hypothetical protein APB76_05965 [Vibrio bivalvicida]